MKIRELAAYIKSLVDECNLEKPMSSETKARMNALDDILDYIYLDYIKNDKWYHHILND
jgi:hypothetical protein